MSIISSIKQVLGLGPAAENHFWDGSVPNQLSLKRGTPEAPGTELMKFLAGVVSFPNQGQSLTPNGYVKLPGGLIVQWGTDTISTTVANLWAGSDSNLTLPIPFPTAGLVTFANSPNIPAQSSQGLSLSCSIYSLSTLSLRALTQLSAVSGIKVNWIAIGY